jgi:hypothetical protein
MAKFMQAFRIHKLKKRRTCNAQYENLHKKLASKCPPKKQV